MTIRNKLYIVVFGADTKVGIRFDVVLFWLIFCSVLFVILESIPDLWNNFKSTVLAIELSFTLIFSFEHFLKIRTISNPFRYLFSFWGLVDLVSILPTYSIILVSGFHYLIVIQSLRLLRVFRIVKLAGFIPAAQVLREFIKKCAESNHEIEIIANNCYNYGHSFKL